MAVKKLLVPIIWIILHFSGSCQISLREANLNVGGSRSHPQVQPPPTLPYSQPLLPQHVGHLGQIEVNPPIPRSVNAQQQGIGQHTQVAGEVHPRIAYQQYPISPILPQQQLYHEPHSNEMRYQTVIQQHIQQIDQPIIPQQVIQQQVMNSHLPQVMQNHVTTVQHIQHHQPHHIISTLRQPSLQHNMILEHEQVQPTHHHHVHYYY